jgi:hypothetical protein
MGGDDEPHRYSHQACSRPATCAAKANLPRGPPYRMIFPPMTDAEIDTLAQDIRANGQQVPIWLYEGKSLDGRNRIEACKRLRIEVKAQPYPGDDPIGFVLSVNLHRRHLDASQRAMVAAKLADLEVGANQSTPGTPIGAAAKLLNVGRGSIDRARVVLKSGNAEIVKAVETGEVPVSKAAEQVKSGRAKRRPVTPASTKLSDDADKYLEKLLDVLGKLPPKRQAAIATSVVYSLVRKRYVNLHELIEEEKEETEAA